MPLKIVTQKMDGWFARVKNASDKTLPKMVSILICTKNMPLMECMNCWIPKNNGENDGECVWPSRVDPPVTTSTKKSRSPRFVHPGKIIGKTWENIGTSAFLMQARMGFAESMIFGIFSMGIFHEERGLFAGNLSPKALVSIIFSPWKLGGSWGLNFGIWVWINTY